jgi:hypothetical protein
MTACETHEFDVIAIGAGGAGLRAAIEAKAPVRQHPQFLGRLRGGRRRGSDKSR